MKRISILLMLALFALASCKDKKVTTPANIDYLSYVDPYIGSGEHGHVFVGVNVPFGMVQLGPNNIFKGWDWCSGYHYSDSIVIGFSHTHLSGGGCSDLGDVLVMPYTGQIRTDKGKQDDISKAYSSYYNHKNEKVSPGYYSLLMDNGVKAELTSSNRCGFHSYEFPKNNEDRRVIIDLKEGTGDNSFDTYIKVVDEKTIEGYRFSKGWSPQHKVYFVLKSDVAFADFKAVEFDKEDNKSYKGKGVKGIMSFKNDVNHVNLKVAISSVSCENAAANMQAEIADWDFAKVKADAEKLWIAELSKIDVTADSEVTKKVFYTAMYHAFIAPTTYSDVNGEYRGHDDKVYSTKTSNYSTLSLWDTYRAAHEFYTIVQPERVDDFVNSMLSIYDQQNKLPIWPLVGGETNQMPGYSAVPVIADAYLKGFKGFDAERAFNAMKGSATYEKQIGVPYLLKNGFIPCDSVYEATSIAMEYAVDDKGIAAMAHKMGKKEDYEHFLKRSEYYKTYFDSEIGFIRPKMYDGTWRTPYNPIKSVHYTGDFCEGNGWQYTFFVPHNPQGLIGLFGGDDKFTKKLDELFVTEGDMGAEASPDISGLIGQYAHGNEPSHHVIYLYAFAGEQWKTAEKARYIMDKFYTDKPDGIIGNEDCGQMSSWYLLSAMGIYQVNPAGGIFVFGSPALNSAVIKLNGGKTFTITAENNNSENIYIQSVKLNGKKYEKSWIDYKDIVAGGDLTFVMGNTPNKSFGTALESRPQSDIK